MSNRRVRLPFRSEKRRSAARKLLFEVMEPRPLLAPMVFTVMNTGDSGGGSLRQAILDADANNTGPNSIQFNIGVADPGFDPVSQTWKITLASALPPITDQVSIDGYTQAHAPVLYSYPSASSPTQILSVPNSSAALDGNNAQQRVIVDGSNTGGATGFVINASHSTIRGLIIDGFGVGVSIPGPNDVGDLVQGNFIGQYFALAVRSDNRCAGIDTA